MLQPPSSEDPPDAAPPVPLLPAVPAVPAVPALPAVPASLARHFGEPPTSTQTPAEKKFGGALLHACPSVVQSSVGGVTSAAAAPPNRTTAKSAEPARMCVRIRRSLACNMSVINLATSTRWAVDRAHCLRFSPEPLWA